MAGRRRFEIRKDPKNGLARVFEASLTTMETAAPDVKVQCAHPDGSGWWFVVRPSGNEPMLRLNVEVWGSSHDELNCLVQDLEQRIASFGGKKA